MRKMFRRSACALAAILLASAVAAPLSATVISAGSLPLEAQLLGSSTVELLTNGGFEDGRIYPWARSNAHLGGSCNETWTTSSIGGSDATSCLPGNSSTIPEAPIEGNYAAYNSFDGEGPKEYRLWQSFEIPVVVDSAVLSWYQTYSIQLYSDFATVPRQFMVELRDENDQTSLGIIEQQTIGTIGGPRTDVDWTRYSVDMTDLLSDHAGQTVSLAFRSVVPEYFTGPGGFGLDDVSLQVGVAAVPEPSTYAMAAAGLVGLIILGRRRWAISNSCRPLDSAVVRSALRPDEEF